MGETKDENEVRGNWTGKFDFFLSCLGYAVGLGNVWRFPYLCYKNGGAVFFIPYVIMLFFIGIPIFFMELSIGQFTSRGPLNCWEMAPIFQGIGAAMLLVSGAVAVYYNVIIAWSIFYLFSSFKSVLPWTTCDNEWNTDGCYDKSWITPSTCTSSGYTFFPNNGTCMNQNSLYAFTNITIAKKAGIKAVSAAEDYMNCYVFGKCESTGIDDLGPIRWKLALCLLAAWVLIFLCLSRGIKSSGKVVYVTALLPYVVLVILFIRGLTLEGHEEGIKFYITNVDWSRLKDVNVWRDAAAQIFFSLSTSWGGLIALSSYNKFHNNILRDALLVPVLNCLTSLFAGFVIFSFIGYLAHMTNNPVSTVVAQGPGLAFVAYPYAISTMPFPQLWAILFFLMLITLGMDSQFTLIETIATALMDRFSVIRRYKTILFAILCINLYLLGLVLCTNGGTFVLTLMDTYLGSWNLLLIAIFECICIGYVYGFKSFLKDIECILFKSEASIKFLKYTKYYWIVCWCFVTPVGLTVMMILSWIHYKGTTDGNYKFPVYAEVVGWLMTSMILLSGFILSFIVVIRQKGCFKERIRASFKPSVLYKPDLESHQKLATHLNFNESTHSTELSQV